MNKKQRIINQRRVNLVRKLAKQVTPFEADMKWIQQFYMVFMAMMTPMQAAGHVLAMSDAKLLKLYFMIQRNDGLNNRGHGIVKLWGNYFDIKFPMVVFASGNVNVASWEEKYNLWISRNFPTKDHVIRVVEVAKTYHYTDCPESGPQSWYLSVFAAAKNGNANAYRIIYEAANQLTNGHFAKYFPQGTQINAAGSVRKFTIRKNSPKITTKE